MKRLTIASDDERTLAVVSRSLDSLGAIVSCVSLDELRAVLADGEADLAIIDAGRSPDEIVQLVEQPGAPGGDVRLLLLLDPAALPRLRMPTRVSSDFMLRDGSAEEIEARVRALLWPGEEATPQELVRIDDLTLNLATYQAYLDAEPIDFTYLEYALFSFLVTHPNRAYSREALLRRVWGWEYYGGSRTVDVHIRRVRAKIGAELSRRLETVRNVGYLWRR